MKNRCNFVTLFLGDTYRTNKKPIIMELEMWRTVSNDENIITLKSYHRIIKIKKIGDNFKLIEGCDGYYDVEHTKEEMFKIIDELRVWVNTT